MAGRNDPCPCGSGKKYKQCCWKKQVEEQAERLKEERFFDQRHRLTYDLHSFMHQKYGGERVFNQQKVEPFDPTLGRFREGIGNVWAFFFRNNENGIRGIDWFLQENGRRYSAEDRRMLERWCAMKVSCYQVADFYEQGQIIEDIWSHERYRMPYCETMVKLPPSSVAIGMIEPYFDNWCIHGAFMWSKPEVKSAIMTKVQQLQEEARQSSGRELSPSDIITTHFPDLINLCHSINNRGK